MLRAAVSSNACGSSVARGAGGCGPGAEVGELDLALLGERTFCGHSAPWTTGYGCRWAKSRPAQNLQRQLRRLGELQRRSRLWRKIWDRSVPAM